MKRRTEHKVLDLQYQLDDVHKKIEKMEDRINVMSAVCEATEHLWFNSDSSLSPSITVALANWREFKKK